MSRAEAMVDHFVALEPDMPWIVFLKALCYQHRSAFEDGIAYIDALQARGVFDPDRQREGSKCAMLQVE